MLDSLDVQPGLGTAGLASESRGSLSMAPGPAVPGGLIERQILCCNRNYGLRNSGGPEACVLKALQGLLRRVGLIRNQALD